MAKLFGKQTTWSEILLSFLGNSNSLKRRAFKKAILKGSQQEKHNLIKQTNKQINIQMQQRQPLWRTLFVLSGNWIFKIDWLIQPWLDASSLKIHSFIRLNRDRLPKKSATSMYFQFFSSESVEKFYHRHRFSLVSSSEYMTNYHNNVKVIQDDPAPHDCIDFDAIMNLMMTMQL